MEKSEIDIAKCKTQAYDEASAMSSNGWAAPVIKNRQPPAKYTHCRDHVLNLTISFACIKQSIKDTLKVFDDFKNKQKSVWSHVFWYVKVCIFRKCI